MTHKKRMLFATPIAALAMFLCSTASADTITFTLIPSADLSTLTAGQNFDVGVYVSGFHTSTADILGVNVLFDPATIAARSDIDPVTAGSLILNPLDDYVGGIDGGSSLAEGIFIAATATIGGDGELFTFHFTAIDTPGLGTLSFFDVFANVDGSFRSSTPGATPLGLSYSLQGDDAAVAPLPGAVWGGTCLMGLLGVARVYRRRYRTG